jgi:hypothetical protein
MASLDGLLRTLLAPGAGVAPQPHPEASSLVSSCSYLPGLLTDAGVRRRALAALEREYERVHVAAGGDIDERVFVEEAAAAGAEECAPPAPPGAPTRSAAG